MRKFCICLPEYPDRQAKAKAHFLERGLPVEWFMGIHAEKFGLKTVWPYEVDNPGSGYLLSQKQVGVHMSHYMLWGALNLLWDEHYMVLEDDAQFPENWHSRFTQVMTDVPRDFDMIYIGACCTFDKPKQPIKGEVWQVQWPFCTHAYVVAKKALPVLLETQRKVWAPIDIALINTSLPKLRVYTVLPSIVSQFDTVYPP